MVRTICGIGLRLCGVRLLPEEKMSCSHLPIDVTSEEYRIGTISFVVFWLPVLPLETVVFFYLEKGWFKAQYEIVGFPAGQNKVWWPHVTGSAVFYVVPCMVVAMMLLISG